MVDHGSQAAAELLKAKSMWSLGSPVRPKQVVPLLLGASPESIQSSEADIEVVSECEQVAEPEEEDDGVRTVC